MKRSVLLAIAMVAATSAPAAAQAVFGPQISWGDDSDLGLGARFELPLSQLVTATDAESPVNDMWIIGSFDYFFPGDEMDGMDLTYWEINANLAYPFEVEGIRPYAGGGLNIAHAGVDFEDNTFFPDASETEVGLNVLGGLKFLLGELDAFAEARIELGGGEQFVLSAGILLGR